jgi:hypothetical protein
MAEKVLALCGGIGGAKLALGLYSILPPDTLTIAVAGEVHHQAALITAVATRPFYFCRATQVLQDYRRGSLISDTSFCVPKWMSISACSPV